MGFVASCNYMGALGHPYNYTRRQIPCTDVTMLQLLHRYIDRYIPLFRARGTLSRSMWGSLRLAPIMSFDCPNKGSSKSLNNQQSGADAIFHIEKSLADLVTFLLCDSNKHPNDILFVKKNLATVTRHSQPSHHIWPARLGWIY